MDILSVLILAIIGIGLMIAHSYFKRGLQLTFEFFLFAFIVAIFKESPEYINRALMQFPYYPYRFTSSSLILNTSVAITGWVFTFYLGWSISELILKRVKPLNNYIFPTLLMCYVVFSSIGYAVEATAINMDWWQWITQDLRFTTYTVTVPFISFEVWSNFGIQYLLLPFFLIKLSKYRLREWKNIFILIPFIHAIPARYHYEYCRVFVEYLILALIIILMIIKPLRFQFNNAKFSKALLFSDEKSLDTIPLIIMMILLLPLCIFDIGGLKDLKLLITLLPLSFCLLLAIKRVPLKLLVLMSIGLLFLGGRIMFLPIIPVLVIATFKIYVTYWHLRA